MTFSLKRFPPFFIKREKENPKCTKAKCKKEKKKSNIKTRSEKGRKKEIPFTKNAKRRKRKVRGSEKGKEKEGKRETGGSGTRFPKKCAGESSFFLCKY
jgi:hypothetical protein